MRLMRHPGANAGPRCAADPTGAVARRASAGPTAVAALLLGLTLAGCEAGSIGAASEEPAEPAALADDSAKAAYSMGYRFADNVRQQFPGELDGDAFVRGVSDRLADRETLVDQAEAERVITALLEAREAEAASEALRTLEEGLAYLEENAQREEVVALDSGLQYEVLVEGDGPKPAATDTVTTHYEGRLIDGTVFDSSYQRGEPASFPLNRVIAGWTEGLQLMSPGAKYRLYVPAALGYGDRAAGAIPPNSTLIFDVELLEVAGADAGEADPESEE